MVEFPVQRRKVCDFALVSQAAIWPSVKKLRSKGSKSSVGGYSDLDLENHQDARLRPTAPKLGPLPYELGQMQTSVRTLIGTGTGPQYQPDGIHVKVNMQ